MISKEWHGEFLSDAHFVALCPADLSERLSEMDRVLYVKLFPAKNDNEIHMWHVLGMQGGYVVAIIKYITTLEYKVPCHLFWTLTDSELTAIRTWKHREDAEVVG